jgi:hypothetical protein
MGEFESAINSWRLLTLGDTVNRASSELAECRAFQEGVDRQTSGNGPAALASYARFLPGRPQSPLADAARERVASLFKQPDVNALASVESCDVLSSLRDEKLLDAAVTPGFHAACGAAYARAADKTKAIATYSLLFKDFSTHKVAAETETALLQDVGWCLELDKFRNDQVLSALRDLLPGLLATCAKAPTTPDSVAIEEAEELLKKYPGHRFTAEVMGTFAQRLFNKVRTDSKSTTLRAAEVTGSPGGGKAIIMLYNDSTEPMRVVLSGPEPRVEEIGGCPNCPVETDKAGICRQQATLKRLVVAPGEYDFAIDSTEATSGAHAHWTLQPGKQYFGCYSTVKTG